MTRRAPRPVPCLARGPVTPPSRVSPRSGEPISLCGASPSPLVLWRASHLPRTQGAGHTIGSRPSQRQVGGPAGSRGFLRACGPARSSTGRARSMSSSYASQQFSFHLREPANLFIYKIKYYICLLFVFLQTKKIKLLMLALIILFKTKSFCSFVF